MTRKYGLGKGLDALIPGGEVQRPAPSGARQIPVIDIQRNPRQPRSQFDSVELQELAASIRLHGVLQPLLVMPLPQGGYQLVAGERRLEASRLAGLSTVPAVVRTVTPQEQLELALIENLQRADLNPLEAAEGFRQLAQDFGLSHEAIAERVGKSRAAVSNTLRLLRLPPACRQALIDGVISEGHARALLALPTTEGQAAALETIHKRNLNVRQTEELVQRLLGQRSRHPKASRRTPEEEALEEQLMQALGTRVNLRLGRKGGSLVIHFYSDEELEALIDRITGSGRG
ncbi:MAG: ParB/RepB/Spo0J family partition protein [Anaerolineales bacterium]|nr:ParB/RepB/Spo0J family partition protein [Anaerolineales bacterium]